MSLSVTAQVIRDTYSNFLQLDDLRGQYPLQSHIFETPENYTRNKRLVIAAYGRALSDSDQARLVLQEAALAERIMTMFEHSYYQWKHARETADDDRVKFLKAVLDYFTGRILTNPRLLWYWSKAGANLEQHFEPETIAYYNQYVIPIGRVTDSIGPFIAATSRPSTSR